MSYLSFVLSALNTGFYKYFLILILAIIEGPVVMSFSGFLWRLDVFNFIPLYFALMTGDLIADALWYGVGYFGGHRFIQKYGKYFNLSEEGVEKFKKFFDLYKTKILFISKITMGFGFALFVLISAGISKINFKKYMAINFLGQIIWTFVLMMLGYFFGSIYLIIDKSLKIGFVIGVFMFLIIIIYGLGAYLRQKTKI